MEEKLHMKNISVVLLECKDFNESLGKNSASLSGHFQEWVILCWRRLQNLIQLPNWSIFSTNYALVSYWFSVLCKIQNTSLAHTEVTGKPCFGFNEFWIWLSYLNICFRVQLLFLLKSVENLSLTLDGKVLGSN